MSASSRSSKVLVIGLDGLEPTLVDAMMTRGELPHLARLCTRGACGRVATTWPAQTPVAWSTFATGVNPGGHGVYDFIRRDPQTCWPDLSLTRFEQKRPYLPPKAVNLRRGTPVWELLSTAGVPSAVIRCPCTFPPDTLRGRMLSGMGVPDLRGGLGTSTFYTTRTGVAAQESEQVVPLTVGTDGRATGWIVGPRQPKTREDVRAEIVIRPDAGRRCAVITSDGQPQTLEVHEGVWSEWLTVKFKLGLLQSVKGMVRFLLVRLGPELELYASPVNFVPDNPPFPISAPATYAQELASRVGTFYTTGMVEDHGGLNNGRFDEAAYLAQCSLVMEERERMLQLELDRFDAGLLFCLFDTPDRLQHMFWRFREPAHPANREAPAAGYEGAIEEHYRACDGVVGRALARLDDQTLVVVMSDHGFSSFQRGVNLNTWLHAQGLLTLEPGAAPGEDAGDFFKHVDWSRTQAYALGIGSVYLNVRGREARGVVDETEAVSLAMRIQHSLEGLVDAERGQPAVRRVMRRDQIYSGTYAAESPDLVVGFAAGYRASWGTALGSVATEVFEDNVKRWGGDHIIDPALVPGVLMMNRPFDGHEVRLIDLAPTILDALGVSKGPDMEGRSLLA